MALLTMERGKDNPILRAISKPIQKINKKLLKFIEDMKVTMDIARHASLTVKYLDGRGRENILKLRNLNARIVQHEVDHIEGHLYIDHLMDEATLRLKKLQQKERD